MKTINTFSLFIYKFCLIAICMIAVIHGSNAQDASQFTYSHLGIDDGMFSQRVYSILQTNDGAIWWGTKNGVERYNGVTITHYQLGEHGKFSNDGGRYIKLMIDEADDDSQQLYAFDDKGFIAVYDAPTDQFREKVNIGLLITGVVQLNDIRPTRHLSSF